MAKSFVVRYRGLKFFVMPYVQLHHLVIPLFAVLGRGEGRGYRLVNLKASSGNSG